jgi:predicted NBD/HSP70 family sugar kinase
MAIVAISTVLDPEVVVLGGGVSQNAGLFRERIVELCTPVIQVMPRIEISALGNDAGIMGAVALILHQASGGIVVTAGNPPEYNKSGRE